MSVGAELTESREELARVRQKRNGTEFESGEIEVEQGPPARLVAKMGSDNDPVN